MKLYFLPESLLIIYWAVIVCVVLRFHIKSLPGQRLGLSWDISLSAASSDNEVEQMKAPRLPLCLSRLGGVGCNDSTSSFPLSSAGSSFSSSGTRRRLPSQTEAQWSRSAMSGAQKEKLFTLCWYFLHPAKCAFMWVFYLGLRCVCSLYNLQPRKASTMTECKHSHTVFYPKTATASSWANIIHLKTYMWPNNIKKALLHSRILSWFILRLGFSSF